MKTVMSAVLLGITLAAFGAPASAQREAQSPWTFTPQIGMYMGGDAGSRPRPVVVSPGTIGEPIAVGMGRSPMLGLGVERRLTKQFSLRGSVQAALFSGPEARVHAGTVSCGTNCIRFVTESDRLGSGGVFAGGVDLAFRLPILWRIEPYLFYGLGSRHAWYDSSDVPDGFSPSTPFGRLTRSGLGARIGAVGFEADVELTSYDTDLFNPWTFVGGGKQADTFLSVGLRRSF
jgi:hypothetical protein